MLLFLLVMMFVLGTIVGSLLNVCIYRLPLEKSILWPGSHCGHCFQAIRWYDNIPLLSYIILEGRCRTCGQSYSIRYLLIEILTGICFAGLFYLEVVDNIHQFDPLAPERGRIEQLFFPCGTAWVIFGYHALLVCLLLVASFCDLDYRWIPLSITVPGTLFGLIGAVIWPWPWPYTPQQSLQHVPPGRAWWMVDPNLGPKQGLYPWPFWGPLPSWFEPGGNWQTGLATGVAGLLVGTFMLEIVRFLFSKGLGVEALGLGDADLMMMAGAFLGWQPVVAAFFVGVFPALFFALGHRVFRWLRERRKSMIRLKVFPEDQQVGLSVDGQPVIMDQLPGILCGLVQERHKTELLLDGTGLERLVDNVVATLGETARQAKIDKVRPWQQKLSPGLLAHIIHFVTGFLRQKPQTTIKLQVFYKDGELELALDHQPVAVGELGAALSALVEAKGKFDLLIDASGYEQWLDQTLRTIRDTALQAGVQTIHRRDEGIPFGPGLAVGIVLAMLYWHAMGPKFQLLFFNSVLLLSFAGVGGALMFIMSGMLGFMRRMRQ